MKTLIVILVFIVLPWLLFFLFYNRTNQYKKTNLALNKSIQKKNQELEALNREKGLLAKLRKENDGYKKRIGDLEMQLEQFKTNNPQPIENN